MPRNEAWLKSGQKKIPGKKFPVILAGKKVLSQNETEKSSGKNLLPQNEAEEISVPFWQGKNCRQEFPMSHSQNGALGFFYSL